MASRTFRSARIKVAVLLLASSIASNAAWADQLQDELLGLFASYAKALRDRTPDPSMFPCENENFRHCIADFFSRRYLGSVVQAISDAANDGDITRETGDPLAFGSTIKHVYDVAAASTAPNRAVLTLVVENRQGDCQPLLRVWYYKESAAWRIDRFESDGSEKQVCEGRKPLLSF